MPASTAIADEALNLLDAMDLLFSEAKAIEDQRTELRQPFFRSVSIELPDDSSKSFSAFSRDLSPTGIGLLHNMPLEPGMAIVSIPIGPGETVRLWTRIKWCRPCGQGWYTSGGQFHRVASS